MKFIIKYVLFCLLMVGSGLQAANQDSSEVAELEKNQVSEALLDAVITAGEKETESTIQDAAVQTGAQMIDLLAHKRRDDADMERLVERLVDQLMNQKHDEGGKYLKKSHVVLGLFLVVGALTAAGFFAKPYVDKQIKRFDQVEAAVNAFDVQRRAGALDFRINELNGRLIQNFQGVDARAAAWANDLNQRDLFQAAQIANIDQAIRALQAEMQAIRGGRNGAQAPVPQPGVQPNGQRIGAPVQPVVRPPAV